MNNSSFLYSFPYVAPQYFGFPTFTHQSPLYFIPPNCYNFRQMNIPFEEANRTIQPTISKYSKNSDFQDTKMQLETTNRSEVRKQKKIKKTRGIKKFKVQRMRDDKGRYSGV